MTEFMSKLEQFDLIDLCGKTLEIRVSSSSDLVNYPRTVVAGYEKKTGRYFLLKEYSHKAEKPKVSLDQKQRFEAIKMKLEILKLKADDWQCHTPKDVQVQLEGMLSELNEVLA